MMPPTSFPSAPGPKRMPETSSDEGALVFKRPFIPISAALAAGIVWGKLFQTPNAHLHPVLLAVLLLMTFILVLKRPKPFYPLLMISFFLLGILQIHLYLHPRVGQNHIVNFFGREKILGEGMVCENPLRSLDKTDLVISMTRFLSKGEYHPVNGRVLLTVHEYYPFHYGDVIRFQTRLHPPRNFHNPGGFDYETHLQFQKILLRGSVRDASQFVVLRSDQGNPLKKNLERFRDRVRQAILGRSPGIEGRIIQAMILGDQKEIPKEIMEKFNRTGTTHIIAISGFNIAMVAIFALFMARLCLNAEYFLLRWNIKRASTTFAIVIVIFYTLIAGAGISVVRASIMAIVFLCSILMNREQDLWNNFALAAFIILIFAPHSLFDISFQLSFAAVASLIFFTPKWIGLFPATPMKIEAHPIFLFRRLFSKGMRTFVLFFLASLSATLGTLPLIMLYFNRVSPITLLANLLCVPILGILAIPVSLLIILAVPFSATLTGWVIQVSEFLVRISLIFIDKLASLSWASFYLSTPSFVEISAFYILLIWSGLLVRWFVMRRNVMADVKMPFSLKVIPAVIVLFFGLNLLYLQMRDFQQENFSVTVVDVGQGNSILVRFPGGKKMLIDGGGFFDNRFDVGKYVLAPYLWHERITGLDTVVLTHPHPDHLNGLLFVIENFNVREVWTNGETSPEENYQTFRRIILQKGIPLKIMTDRTPPVNISGVQIEVLHPPERVLDSAVTDSANHLPQRSSFVKPPSILYDETNDRSLVLKFTFGKRHFLFPADISGTVERRLVYENIDLQSDVIVVPHHGSHRSSHVSFVEKVKPQIAVVSCGSENLFGFPNPDVLRRYESIHSEVFRTDHNGAVTIKTDGQNLTAEAFHSKKNSRVSE